MAREAWILGGARTPMAEYNGHFRGLTEVELGAVAARAALQRSGVNPAQIHHVVFGNALQTSGNAVYGARHVALKAGLPIEVPALTLNRLCGSGI
ncbi:MAG: acetyl-CoA C-acyltransferase, partial [Acidobacteria bacterium]|nr:acetyl-CoA C-acyltransferase [Acidobacteriota bacterium]